VLPLLASLTQHQNENIRAIASAQRTERTISSS